MNKSNQALVDNRRALVKMMKGLMRKPHWTERYTTAFLAYAIDPEITEARISKFIDSESECWSWKGAHYSGRPMYSPRVLNTPMRQVKAYHILYGLTNGPFKATDLVPSADSSTLDHLCGNKWCVNPSHLEPVSNAENIRRAYAA